MSAADQVGAVIAFLVPFVGAYLLYRAVCAVVELRDGRRQKCRADELREAWVMDPLSWIALEDAMGEHRLGTIDQWRERCQ
jgi:hypothetical protein